MQDLKSFFIWCAGSDTNILNECTQSEQNKHVGLGTFVCIPAVLAFFSMSYAISTFVDIIPLYLFCGLIWGLIVFCIDRYIVSTFKKHINSDMEHNMREDLISLTFIVRILFAIFLGIAIAHPITLRYFDDTITKTLNQQQLDRFNKNYQTDVNKLELREQNLQAEENHLDNQAREDHIRLNTEVYGLTHSRDYNIDATSNENSPLTHYTGKKGYGSKASIRNDIYQRSEQTLAQKRIEDKPILDEIKQQKYQLDSTRRNLSKNMDSHYDYLTRVAALGTLTEKNKHANLCATFIICFFVFVDILPITYKALTSAGSYDYKLRRTESDLSAQPTLYYSSIQDAHTEAIFDIKSKIEIWHTRPDRDFHTLVDEMIKSLRKLDIIWQDNLNHRRTYSRVRTHRPPPVIEDQQEINKEEIKTPNTQSNSGMEKKITDSEPEKSTESGGQSVGNNLMNSALNGIASIIEVIAKAFKTLKIPRSTVVIVLVFVVLMIFAIVRHDTNLQKINIALATALPVINFTVRLLRIFQ